MALEGPFSKGSSRAQGRDFVRDQGLGFTECKGAAGETRERKRDIVARITQEILISILSDIIADRWILKHDRAGRILLTRRPVFPEDREFSHAQKGQQGRLRDAALYAKSVIGREAIYTVMAAGTARTAYNVAISDWFHAPVIAAMDLSCWTGRAGEPIRIMALDDVMVKRVTVSISDEQGRLLERGEADPEDDEWWVYTTTQAVAGHPRVTAVAEDLPGNTTQVEEQLAGQNGQVNVA